MNKVIREHHIKHENDDFWVADQGSVYTVFCNVVTGSVSDSSYAHDADGLALAIARCDYRAGVRAKQSAHNNNVHRQWQCMEVL